jgi:mRNA-degrading endonuclease RelE of RelBE toxin-antitoxin system
MKIILSKNYRKDILKASGAERQKLQEIIEKVHQGVDVYEAIRSEFLNLDQEKEDQIKDYVFQVLGMTVETSDPNAYNVEQATPSVM